MKQITFRTVFIAVLLASLGFTPTFIQAKCLDAPRLTGVNLAGAEFNSKKLPGEVFKDYTYPNTAEMTYIAAQGANIIRLPFRWERIQHQINAALDPGELKRLQNTINQAKALGFCVLLDVHNYATYHAEPIVTPVLQDGFVALWIALAAQLGNSEHVALGLMNEPAHMPLMEWAALAKRTLAALRTAGADNLVVIGGGDWNGLHSWFNEKDGNSNAKAFANLKDPLKRTIIEVHQYADSYYSGMGQDCHPPEHFEPRFARISQWAKDNNLQLLLGEFGVAATPPCLATLDRFLQLMQGSEWKGWTYWAAGSWWGSYPFALNANSATPSPQWDYLKTYFYRPQAVNPPLPPEDATQ
jgi:endoglucanase